MYDSWRKLRELQAICINTQASSHLKQSITGHNCIDECSQVARSLYWRSQFCSVLIIRCRLMENFLYFTISICWISPPFKNFPTDFLRSLRSTCNAKHARTYALRQARKVASYPMTLLCKYDDVVSKCVLSSYAYCIRFTSLLRKSGRFILLLHIPT